MTFDDYFGIMQTLARYGHALDSGAAPFDTVVTEDVVFDLTDVGGPVVQGRREVLVAMTGFAADAYARRGPDTRAVLSHHTTNSELIADRGDEVDVRSKYLRIGQKEPGPMPVLYGQYHDTLVRTADGWRISTRTVIAHNL
jgi:hypothetical protein